MVDLGNNCTIMSFCLIADMLQPLYRDGLHSEVLESRSIRICPQTGQCSIVPCKTASKHGVVVRVASIPLLPKCVSSLSDPVSIRRKVLLGHYLECKRAHSVLREDLEEESCPKDAGMKMRIGAFFRESGPDLFESFGRHAHL